ncbi:MAG: hypothetical protein ACKOWE_01120 [Micrococcales bacterium]
MKNEILLADSETAADLQSYLQRAKRIDPDGLVRLRAFGRILTAYVAVLYAGSLMDSGPTVLGLRTHELGEETEIDVVVPIAAVLDRLANLDGSLSLPLPDSVKAAWAGISPPRSGWQAAGTINEQQLTQIAKDGIAEVAQTIPESVGGPIAARIRGEIWGRAIDLTSAVPTGAAFAAAGLGFLTENEEVELYKVEGWVRLSSHHGHVLAKVATRF